jgi:hypothetical protein
MAEVQLYVLQEELELEVGMVIHDDDAAGTRGFRF